MFNNLCIISRSEFSIASDSEVRESQKRDFLLFELFEYSNVRINSNRTFLSSKEKIFDIKNIRQQLSALCVTCKSQSAMRPEVLDKGFGQKFFGKKFWTKTRLPARLQKASQQDNQQDSTTTPIPRPPERLASPFPKGFINRVCQPIRFVLLSGNC